MGQMRPPYTARVCVVCDAVIAISQRYDHDEGEIVEGGEDFVHMEAEHPERITNFGPHAKSFPYCSWIDEEIPVGTLVYQVVGDV